MLLDREGNFEFETITAEEISFAINRIATNAKGQDGIPAVILKKLAPVLVPHIMYVVNNCITKSYFPRKWKFAIVKPIPKTTNPIDVSEFRPISILPALSKVLEKILELQIRNFIDSKLLLSDVQSGFRPKHSTTTALLKVMDDISEALKRGEITVLALLD